MGEGRNDVNDFFKLGFGWFWDFFVSYFFGFCGRLERVKLVFKMLFEYVRCFCSGFVWFSRFIEFFFSLSVLKFFIVLFC